MVRGSNPGGGEIFCARPDRPWGLPSPLYSEYCASSQGVKRPWRGVDHPLAPRLKKEKNYIPTSPLGLHGRLQGDLYPVLLPVDTDLLVLRRVHCYQKTIV
jgi:hypothetical protein